MCAIPCGSMGGSPVRLGRLAAAGLGLLLVAATAGCGSAGSGGAAQKGSGATGSTTGGAGITLAKGASKLCSAAPTTAALQVKMTTDAATAVDQGTVGLQYVNANGSNQDGTVAAGTVDGRQAVQPQPGTAADGSNFTYEEIYFATNGAVDPAVQNVEVCLELYDGAKGQGIHLDYSGNNADGPVGGKYDAAPEIYVTAGSKKWLTIAFSLTAINFQSGAPGLGGENYGTDFRVSFGSPLQTGIYFDRAWLVAKSVPATQSLAAAPAAAAALSIA